MNDVRKHYAAISICCAVLCLCVVAAPRAQQTNQAAAQGGDFKISVGVNSVLVPVVVRDSHGRGVGDLTQKDFELFDQDKPRPIAGFSVQKRAAGAESAAAASATSPAPTRASDAAKNALTATAPVPATSPATPERFVVFLFDDMHFDPGDLLRIPVKALRRRGPVWKFAGEAFVGDTLCAEAEFSAMIRDSMQDGDDNSSDGAD